MNVPFVLIVTLPHTTNFNGIFTENPHWMDSDKMCSVFATLFVCKQISNIINVMEIFSINIQNMPICVELMKMCSCYVMVSEVFSFVSYVLVNTHDHFLWLCWYIYLLSECVFSRVTIEWRFCNEVSSIRSKTYTMRSRKKTKNHSRLPKLKQINVVHFFSSMNATLFIILSMQLLF